MRCFQILILQLIWVVAAPLAAALSAVQTQTKLFKPSSGRRTVTSGGATTLLDKVTPQPPGGALDSNFHTKALAYQAIEKHKEWVHMKKTLENFVHRVLTHRHRQADHQAAAATTNPQENGTGTKRGGR